MRHRWQNRKISPQIARRARSSTQRTISGEISRWDALEPPVCGLAGPGGRCVHSPDRRSRLGLIGSHFAGIGRVRKHGEHLRTPNRSNPHTREPVRHLRTPSRSSPHTREPVRHLRTPSRSNPHTREPAEHPHPRRRRAGTPGVRDPHPQAPVGAADCDAKSSSSRYAAFGLRPWHILNFLPEPQGQGWLRPTPAYRSFSTAAALVAVPCSSGAE